MSRRPAPELLDLLLSAHGLAVAAMPPASEAAPGTTTLRVVNASELQGAAVDLSKLGR